MDPSCPTSIDMMEKGDGVSSLPSTPRSGISFMSLLRGPRSNTSPISNDVQDERLAHLSWSWNPFRSRNAKEVFRSEPFVQKLTDHQKGYPRLAAFQASDEGFTLYRKFAYLQARVLLDKQDQLRVLEEELNELDSDLYEDRPSNTETRANIMNDELSDRRQKLMKDIEEAYCSYSNLMVAASQMTAFSHPSKSAYRSVDAFSQEDALCEAENCWIAYKDDLLTLKPGREHAWLDDGIEHILRALREYCPLVDRIFCSAETKQKTEGRDGSVEVYYTRSRVDKLVNSIILFVILALLIVPIWLLYFFVAKMDNGRADAPCMGVLLVSTLLFSAVLAMFTRAKRHEILAAAAAYCAVLVVFLGNVPQLAKEAAH